MARHGVTVTEWHTWQAEVLRPSGYVGSNPTGDTLARVAKRQTRLAQTQPTEGSTPSSGTERTQPETS